MLNPQITNRWFYLRSLSNIFNSVIVMPNDLSTGDVCSIKFATIGFRIFSPGIHSYSFYALFWEDVLG